MEMVGTYIASMLLFVVFLVLGIAFLLGRGEYIMLADNKRRRKKEEKRVVKRICRYIGAFTLTIDIGFFVSIIATMYNLKWLLMADFVIMIIAIIACMAIMIFDNKLNP